MPKRKRRHRKNPLGISWFWWVAGGVAAYAYLRPEEAKEKLDILTGKGGKGYRWVKTPRGYACVETRTQKTVEGKTCVPIIGPAPGTEVLEGLGDYNAGPYGGTGRFTFGSLQGPGAHGSLGAVSENAGPYGGRGRFTHGSLQGPGRHGSLGHSGKYGSLG